MKYDPVSLLAAQNTFKFEKKDWFSVPIEALPNGSRLVRYFKINVYALYISP